MITIKQPGLQTSVQDLGRPGYQQFGVVGGGAMDTVSLRIANMLVGNAPGSAALEAALAGPAVVFEEDRLIALAGADLSPEICGMRVPMCRPVAVKKGSVLRFGRPVSGCRVYIAIAGGIDVPEVMGSRSTYIKAGIGGFCGRLLQKGDRLPAGEASEAARALTDRLLGSGSGRPFSETGWSVAEECGTSLAEEAEVRMMRGPQFGWFDEESRERFFGGAFIVSSESDRMGYRLKGAGLKLAHPRELLSEAVVPGSVQVPSGGSPILLMADRQTTGGYPKIGQAATADLPVIAQLPPGGRLRFREVSVEEAQSALVRQTNDLRHLQAAIELKMKGDS
ncbi:5-oxoprolinase subunit C family protein [Edaphobacillus lindanitolerans]|uniref:Antagonist of KipI n=1 Tax=Edaphobacillus lindanitolerans TaxID=550447 RepID=A0A1U7PKC0_9BACI|nr:biotin-dependent carboxyltransferase family protein [Edaphobacillus lindanitolerans]SIT71471.1 antagonist of KipI [Edaphobacillus lindanitolerans]